MAAVRQTCGECGRSYYSLHAHAEECNGVPVRLRQPVHEPWDWAGLMADQDADDRRVAPYLSDDSGDDGVPWERRH